MWRVAGQQLSSRFCLTRMKWRQIKQGISLDLCVHMYRYMHVLHTRICTHTYTRRVYTDLEVYTYRHLYVRTPVLVHKLWLCTDEQLCATQHCFNSRWAERDHDAVIMQCVSHLSVATRVHKLVYCFTGTLKA